MEKKRQGKPNNREIDELSELPIAVPANNPEEEVGRDGDSINQVFLWQEKSKYFCETTQ